MKALVDQEWKKLQANLPLSVTPRLELEPPSSRLIDGITIAVRLLEAIHGGITWNLVKKAIIRGIIEALKWRLSKALEEE